MEDMEVVGATVTVGGTREGEMEADDHLPRPQRGQTKEEVVLHTEQILKNNREDVDILTKW